MLKFFGKTAGVMWIDKQDKQVAPIEAMLFENIGSGDEVSLPSQANINLSVRVVLVKGLAVNQLVKS